MHDAAYQWVATCVDQLGPFSAVCEIGSRDINGSVRALFGDARYLGVDLVAGPGVDVVGDVIDLAAYPATLPVEAFDCVVTTEALEHHPAPFDVLLAARRLLRTGGVLIATMAGPGRTPHSGLIEGPVQPGEHYRNIGPDELERWLGVWAQVTVDQAGADVRCWAVK